MVSSQELPDPKSSEPNLLKATKSRNERNSYRVANRAGVYKDLVSRAYLSPVQHANADMLGLAGIVVSWSGLPTVSIRAIAASLSHSGGQGLLHCACKELAREVGVHVRKQDGDATRAVTKETLHAQIMIRSGSGTSN